METLNKQKAELEILLRNNNSKAVMEKWLRSELAYTSNAIEGNTLTRKETELVIEENLTSASKPFVYYQEAINHAKAYSRVLEVVKNNLHIDEKEVLNLHKIILSGIDEGNAGFYRNCMVRISGSRVIMPNPIKVPALMTEFFEWLDKSDINDPMTAIEAHYKFISIHPFTDGNGRCGRLLMNMLLLKSGFSPLIVRPIDRKRYINSIEKRQLTNLDDSYFKFMKTALSRSLKTIINMLDTTKDIEMSEKLLTISKFAKLAGIPTSTIRYWIQTEKLKPIEYTDSGYMLFSAEQKKIIDKIKD